MYFVKMNFNDFDFTFLCRNNLYKTVNIVEKFKIVFEENCFKFFDVTIEAFDTDLVIINNLSDIEFENCDYLVSSTVNHFLSEINLSF